MSDIKDWSTTAVNNNSASPDGFPEGMAPSGVNNSAREVMASVRSHYDNLEWRDWGHTIAYASATTFTTAVGDGDTTTTYHADRRVKAAGTTTGTIYGTISGSAHTTQTTVTVVWDSGSLNNEALTIELGLAVVIASIGEGAVISSFVSPIPATTVMVFYQAAAPTGWTQVATQNDKALRVVSGTGGGVGGTHALSTPPSTSHTHTGPSHSHAIPNHTHQWYNYTSSILDDQSFTSAGSSTNLTTTLASNFTKIEADGGFITQKLSADYYTSTIIGGPGNTGLSGDTSTSSDGPTAFSPQYIDVIICSKD